MTTPDPRYRTPRWQHLRQHTLTRDGHHCTTPGCTTPATGRALHVDHIHEVKDGGPFWDPTNLTTLCRLHHTAKTLNTIATRTANRPSPDA